MREHHGNVRRAVLERASNGNRIAKPAVGEGPAIDVVKPARRQGHRGSRTQGGEDALIAGVKVNGLAIMAVRQHDGKARRRLFQGFDRQGNALSEDVNPPGTPDQ